MRTQTRIEATLTALERLAQGELTTVDDFVPVDVAELLDRAAHDAMHNYPGLDVSLASSTTVLMLGMPAGLRLVIDNAIANAVKHGGANQVRLSVVSSAAGVEIAVDDNGSGVPRGGTRRGVRALPPRHHRVDGRGRGSAWPWSRSRPRSTVAQPRWRSAHWAGPG